MSAVEELEEAPAKPVLRLLRGGKGPPSDYSGKDWMSPLNIGAVFTCRKKGQTENYALMLLQIVFKHDKSVVIADSLNSNPYAIVDPVEFCKRHEFFELINNGDTDANDLRSIPDGGVENDANAEGGQPSDDGSGPE